MVHSAWLATLRGEVEGFLTLPLELWREGVRWLFQCGAGGTPFTEGLYGLLLVSLCSADGFFFARCSHRVYHGLFYMQLVFVLGGHKSGTSLLRSLLDNVGPYRSLPFESHFVKLSGVWTRYPRGRAAPDFERSYSKFVEAVRRRLRRLRVASPTGGSHDVEHIDGDWICEQMLAAAPGDDPRAWFECYMSAAMEALGQPLGDAVLVEKSVEHAEHAAYLQALFPEAKFVGIVRNPYATLVAMRRFEKGQKVGSLRVSVATIRESLYNVDRARRVLRNMHLVRYEDLVTSPSEVMQGVASFLGTSSFEPLRPTVLGKPWAGNSSSGERFEGIASSVATKWQRECTAIEVELVNRHLGAARELFGYPRCEPGGSPWVPARGESAQHYVANRLLMRGIVS